MMVIRSRDKTQRRTAVDKQSLVVGVVTILGRHIPISCVPNLDSQDWTDDERTLPPDAQLFYFFISTSAL